MTMEQLINKTLYAFFLPVSRTNYKYDDGSREVRDFIDSVRINYERRFIDFALRSKTSSVLTLAASRSSEIDSSNNS